MDSTLIYNIQYSGKYPEDLQLQEEEISVLYDKYKEAISTTNGDTENVEITARQLILFLQFYMRENAAFCSECKSYQSYEDGPCICYAR